MTLNMPQTPQTPSSEVSIEDKTPEQCIGILHVGLPTLSVLIDLAKTLNNCDEEFLTDFLKACICFPTKNETRSIYLPKNTSSF